MIRWILYIFITLTACLHSPILLAQSLCREIFARQISDSINKNLPIPVGLSLESFNALLETFRSDSAFQDAEAIVLYGSRTRSNPGPRPSQESDLDVMTFYKAKVAADTILDRQEAINQRLEKYSLLFGFPINDQIPVNMKLADALSRRSFLNNGLSKDQEKSIAIELSTKAKVENWTPSEYKVQYLKAIPYVSKDAIIILVGITVNSPIVAKFLELGFRNIILLASL